MDGPTLRRCSCCDEMKTVDEFYPRRTTGGIASLCKSCTKLRSIEWQKTNPERTRATRERARAKAGEECLRAQNRENMRAWRARNPERNAELRAASSARYRGAAEIGERFSPQEIYHRDGFKCHICGRSVSRRDATLDHLIPVSRGGSHARANVATAHRSCNCSRGAGRLAAQLLLIG